MSQATTISDFLSSEEIQKHQAAQWGTVTKTYRMTKGPVQWRRIAHGMGASFATGMLFVTMCQGFAQADKNDFKGSQQAVAVAGGVSPLPSTL